MNICHINKIFVAQNIFKTTIKGFYRYIVMIVVNKISFISHEFNKCVLDMI